MSTIANGAVSSVGVSFGNPGFTRGTARDVENGGMGGVIGWTRWTGGTFTQNGNTRTLNDNEGLHIVYGLPVTNLPTAGTAMYSLVGATKPTSDLGTAPPGTFTGKIAVAFGTRKVGWESTIDFNGKAYLFNTTGGLAAPSVTLEPNGTFVGSASGDPRVDPGGLGYGFLAGDGGNYIGFKYYLTTTGAANGRITGVAAFARDGASLVNAGPTAVAKNQLTQAFAGGQLVVTAVDGDVTYQDGKLAAFFDTSAFKTRVAASIQESGRLADVIGWARWTGYNGDLYATQPENGGLHLLSGTMTPVASLPTSGTAQYALAGGTRPTLTGGTTAPGTLTGSMAVAFGATNRVGYDITVNVGQFGWNVKTTGGVANPSQSTVTIRGDGSFGSSFSQTNGVTGLNAASCANGCSGSLNGRFFGPGGSHIGAAFNLVDTAGGTPVTATAVAVFAK